MHGSFDSFDDLPLAQAGVWLFTSSWEGMPTTIIELGSRGVALVASAVGGIPELIRPETGWPIPPDAETGAYVAALRAALNSPEEAVRRAEALQHLVASRYTNEVYDRRLDALLNAEGTS
jgi:glycosyltransferase involved in cell wall biosynthesis